MAGALLTGVAFSPGGTMVAVSGDSSDDTMHFARVYRRDAEDGQPLEVRHEAAVSVLAFTPDGRYLVSGTTRGQGVVTDLQTSESTRFSHGARIVAVAFKPHGQLLATVSADGLAKIWTIPQLTELVLDGQTSRSSDALAFSPDGRYLLTGQDLLWDLKIDPALERPAGFGSPTAVAFTSDGETIVAPTSRNAPCPCGSGQKYKHCHGQAA